MRALWIALAIATTALTACGDEAAPQVIRVPEDHATIQAAVDASRPGDLVLVGPGNYRESVVIVTPEMTLRGTDRNAVTIDGEFDRINGVVVAASGVAVENLTVANHTDNGVLISGDYAPEPGDAAIERYRVSYVTTPNNGLYGVYAFGVSGGVIEHTHASGTAGAGFYVGQCKPCDALLTNVVAEFNTLGYQGANGSSVWVVESVFRNNRTGIVTLSETVEGLAPQVGGLYAANLVENNASSDAPTGPGAGFGVGIAIAGGNENTVRENLVRGHPSAGILITEQGSFTMKGGFQPFRNRIEANDLGENALDLLYAPARPDTDGFGNCFSDNLFTRSSPAEIEALMPCDGSGPGTLASTPFVPLADPEGPEYPDVPAPPVQPNRPGDVTELPTRVERPAEPDPAGLRRPQ